MGMKDYIERDMREHPGEYGGLQSLLYLISGFFYEKKDLKVDWEQYYKFNK